MISDAVAQSVEVALATGRGGGEGRLFVTDRRLIHWTDGTPSPSFHISRADIAGVEINWIILPGMSNFRVILKKDQPGPDNASFYMAKRAAKKFRTALS